MENLKEKWEKSYQRNENWILSPKEEVVKFLNRFIRKRIGYSEFEDLIHKDRLLKGLDLGCGIGRQVILLKQYGIEGYGVDISKNAISAARKMAKDFGYPELKNNLEVISETKLPFKDSYFDLAISDSVLDSMEFKTAKKYVAELDRVVNDYLYVSLISGLDSDFSNEFDGEIVVNDSFEQGTIQSYFTRDKINSLFSDSSFEIEWGTLQRFFDLDDDAYRGRYYLVLKKPNY